MDEIWNKRHEKLRNAVRVAALELFDHVGAAGFECELGHGLKLAIGERASMAPRAPDQETPTSEPRPFAGLTKKLEKSGFIGPAEKEPLGGKLPSRFQLHDTVRAQGVRGTVIAITFMLVDGWGKVAYDVDCGAQTLPRVLSDDVQPAQPQHLRAVPTAPESED